MNSLAYSIPEDLIGYMSDDEFDEYARLMQLEAASVDFKEFIKVIMPTYVFNWHHEVLIERLNKLIHQKNQRIMVFMPPRHGKSEIVSRKLPAFVLGQNPDTRIMACSYSANLAATFNRDVQRVLEDEVYQEIFPETVLPGTRRGRMHPDNKKYKRQSNYFELIDKLGFLLSPGVEGSITGLGADLFIIDDPIKNEEEAMSATVRENVYNWYKSTAYTRLEGGANLLIVQTRWHKEDLSGKLLQEMEIDGEKWEVINFPAIASEKNRMPNDPRDPGEPLWEFKYNKKRLDVIKKQVGSRVWSSLYQQSPTIEGGNIVKEEWFQYYQTLPFDINNWRECYVVNSWDVNFKQSGKSYNVGVAIAKHKADYYFIDMWRRRCGIIQTMKGIAQLNAKFPCKAVLIEEKANGSAILQLMKKRISSLIPIEPGTSKDERLESIAPIIEAGNFHLPANSPLSKLVIEEMTSFPNADNDDIVDAISQALNRFMELKGLRHLMAATKW